MITDKLRQLVATTIKTTIDNGGNNAAQLGFGGNSTNPISNALDVPSGVAVSVQTANSDENVIEVKVSVVGGLVTGRVIRELGLFNSSDMIQRVNFDGIGPFSSGETIEFFILLEVE